MRAKVIHIERRSNNTFTAGNYRTNYDIIADKFSSKLSMLACCRTRRMACECRGPRHAMQVSHAGQVQFSTRRLRRRPRRGRGRGVPRRCGLWSPDQSSSHKLTFPIPAAGVRVGRPPLPRDGNRVLGALTQSRLPVSCWICQQMNETAQIIPDHPPRSAV